MNTHLATGAAMCALAAAFHLLTSPDAQTSACTSAMPAASATMAQDDRHPATAEDPGPEAC